MTVAVMASMGGFFAWDVPSTRAKLARVVQLGTGGPEFPGKPLRLGGGQREPAVSHRGEK